MKKMNLEELGKVSGGSILTLSPVFDNFAVEAYIPGGNLNKTCDPNERVRRSDLRIDDYMFARYPRIDENEYFG